MSVASAGLTIDRPEADGGRGSNSGGSGRQTLSIRSFFSLPPAVGAHGWLRALSRRAVKLLQKAASGQGAGYRAPLSPGSTSRSIPYDRAPAASANTDSAPV